MHRIALIAPLHFVSGLVGVKNFISEILTKYGIGCYIDDAFTDNKIVLYMEGYNSHLYFSRNILLIELSAQYPTIVIGPWEEIQGPILLLTVFEPTEDVKSYIHKFLDGRF